MKTLIIFSFVVLIAFSNSQPTLDDDTNFKCPDDKIKIGNDVCAIKSSKDGTTDIPNVVYVKKKSCGKNKKCKDYSTYYNKDTKDDIAIVGSHSDTIYTCQRELKLLKIKKKCNYHAECNTGFCNNGKCAAYGDIDCHSSGSSGNSRCGPGRYCKQTATSTYKCTDYAKENGNCLTASCAPGLWQLWSTDGSSCTCKK